MRLATWNVLHGATDHLSPADNDALAAAVEGLGADVLALQELDRFQPRSGGVDQLAHVAGGHEARFAAAIVGTPGGEWRAATDADGTGGTGGTGGTATAYGIGLVSRRPVRAWHVLRLTAAPFRLPVRATAGKLQFFGDEPRVALAAELDGLTVVATHLSFVPGWNAKHLRQVTRWAATLPGPQVVMGDLNLEARLVGPVSRWELLGRAATFPARRPRRQIDHVLGRGALPPVTAVASPVMPLSDHLPLVVDLAER